MNSASKRHRFLTSILFALLALRSPAANNKRTDGLPTEPRTQAKSEVKLADNYGKLPLAFEPNVGQADSGVRFLARGGGVTAFFADSEITLVLSGNPESKRTVVASRKQTPPSETEHVALRMKLENSNRPRHEIGLEKLPGISNYFIGNNPAKWRTHVPQYARIQYVGVYQGIDLVWYGSQGHLEFDFVVSPGADPQQIQIAYEGADSLAIAANGDLVLQTALGEIRSRKPRVYQEINGGHAEVAARYAIMAHHRIRFDLSHYDRYRELRIDPVVLAYSTYLGGSGTDYGLGIAVDAAGSAYVTGSTGSTNFPTTESAFQATYQSDTDAFITKFTPAGDAVVYSTYLGGTNSDSASAIAVDAAGSAYVTGSTASYNFPTQSPYQATIQGNNSNGFVTKLTPAGDGLAYSTYLGGKGGTSGRAIAVDAADSAYITGYTSATNFPTQSAFQSALLTTFPENNNAFVTKLTRTGNGLVYSTYLGGNGDDGAYGIAVDASGAAYVTGNATSTNFPTQAPFQAHGSPQGSAFVTKFSPEGNALAYSTYLGGSGQDWGFGIAVDAGGSAYVTGHTSSPNFPTQSPFEGTFQGGAEAFVTKLTPSGEALVYSTYLGGGQDEGRGIAVDGAGSAYVTGFTGSPNFPTQSPYQATLHGVQDAFITKMTPAGSALIYSTYLGGSGDGIGNGDSGIGIALDGSGSVYVAGYTTSPDFPTQLPLEPNLQAHFNAFVSKLSVINTAVSFIGSAATGTSPFAAGQLVSIYGSQLGPPAGSGLQLGPGGVVTNSNSGTQVLFDGAAAPILYTSAGQVNAVIPCAVAGHSSTQMIMEYMGVQSPPLTVPLGSAAPGIFTADGRGQGQAAALNQDNSFNSPSNPAAPGSIVTFYATGVGLTSPCVDGQVYQSNFPTLTLPVIVGVGGSGAQVLYGGQAPDLVSGVAQFNIAIPSDASPGVVPLTLVVGGVFSTPGVTIAVK